MEHMLKYQVDRAQVKRYLGHRPGQTENSDRVDALIEQLIGTTGDRARPQGMTRTFLVDHSLEHGVSLIGTDLLLTATDLQQLLAGCSLVTVLAITIGPKVDQLIGDLLADGQYTAATIVDAIGSDAAEQTMEQLNGLVKQRATDLGFSLTPRFSPGYGDVPLTLQQELIQLLQAEQIDIAVTASSTLVPRKSVTAVLGWRHGLDNVPGYDKCSHCKQTDCLYRQPPIKSEHEEKMKT